MDWLDFLFEINILFCYIIEESCSDIFGGRDISNFNNQEIYRYLIIFIWDIWFLLISKLWSKKKYLDKDIIR